MSDIRHWQGMKAVQKLEQADFRRALQNKIGVELRVTYQGVVHQKLSARFRDLLNRLDEGSQTSGSELK
jgi:hypothetical protein